MIRASNLTLRRGSKVLLDSVDFVINPGERVGVVGKNGAGKSSLFALLEGKLDSDAGQVSQPPGWRIAAVEQHIETSTQAAREFVIDGDTALRSVQQERRNTDPDNGQKIAELEMALEDMQAWSAESRAEKLLAGLGFSPSDWMRPVSEFSGGWQMRLALARALMAPSDLLLLDEPTNHLDINAILWLERWLSSYFGTVLLISHDTEFLDSVARSILHFDQGKLIHYRGSYESFLLQRAERLRQNQLAIERQTRETERLQAFINRFRAKASKARQAQSRVKALDRMQTLAPLRQDAGITISIPQPEQIPDPLLVLDKVTAGYPVATADAAPKIILQNVTLSVRAGSRIGILGVNGAGKSTLIKTLFNELQPLTGTYTASKGLQVAYFAQQQLDMLDKDASPLQHLTRLAPDTREQELRNYLGSFGFSGDMALSRTEPFSGGEKARLALALIVWQKPNLLLLDEPSNHLDVDTREALALALAEYEGSVLLVSHDRHLLRTTVDEFWIVADGAVHEFDGDLDDYRHYLSNLSQITHSQTGRSDSEEHIQTTIAPIDRREQRRLEAEQRQKLARLRKPLENRQKILEDKMEKASSRLEQLDQLIADPGLYSDDRRRSERIQTLEEHGELSKSSDILEAEWLELQQQLDELAVSASQDL